MAVGTAEGRARVSELADQLETLWAIWDRHLAAVPPPTWRKRYGRDWRFEDVPYHLAYYDRLHVIETIEHGAALPEDRRWVLSSFGMTGAWNASEFAKRKPGQTPQESIAQMCAERERLRGMLARLTDADLAKPAFNRFVGIGWSTVERALVDCREHHWSEGFEFVYRLTGRAPEFTPALDHDGVDFYLRLLPIFLETQAAARVGSFTMRWDITGPGGGVWTIRVADAKAWLEEKPTQAADLTLSMSPTTFLLLFKNIANPLALILTRKIRVRGFRKMRTFGKLFPPPRPEREFPVPAGGHAFAA